MDRLVTDTCEKYFPFEPIIEEEKKTGRFELIFKEGSEFIRECLEKNIRFDAVIIDCTDCTLDGSVSSTLFNVPFYKALGTVMTEDASFSQQLSFVQNESTFKKMCEESGFNTNYIFKATTPEYGGALPLGCASKGQKLNHFFKKWFQFILIISYLIIFMHFF